MNLFSKYFFKIFDFLKISCDDRYGIATQIRAASFAPDYAIKPTFVGSH